MFSQNTNFVVVSESCGLSVERSAHDWKVMGSIPIQSSMEVVSKACLSGIDFCTQFWFIVENKKNIGCQMGHTKKICCCYFGQPILNYIIMHSVILRNFLVFCIGSVSGILSY